MEAVDILIAEGNPADAKVIEGALDRMLHNRVTVLTTAESARDYLLQSGPYAADRRSPDLIIIDVDLIGDGCWDLLAGLREQPGLEDSLVVVVSGSPSIEQAGEAEDAGVNWYSGKPLDIENLSRIVEDLEDLGLAVVRTRIPPPETL